MKISITSGKAEGPTQLNAFDNALLDAGIGDVNLIPVSSILPPRTQIIRLPKLIKGKMLNCVLAKAHSSRKGDLITAVIAVATSNDFGCVVEHSGVNQKPKELRREAEAMVRHMMQVRGLRIREIIIEHESHIVKRQGAVVAAVVFLKEEGE